MTKISKVFLYIFTLFVALMVIAFLALTITSSYGGIKLNFLEERIENSIKKQFSHYIDVKNIVLKRNYDRGFYLDVDEAVVSRNKDQIIRLNNILLDFDIINVLLFSIDENIKFKISQTHIKNNDTHISIKNLATNYDEYSNINISTELVEFKSNTLIDKFSLKNMRFYTSSNSIYQIINSDIKIKTFIGFDELSYELLAEFKHRDKSISFKKFIGKDFYLNSGSLIQFDSNSSIVKTTFNISSKSEPFLKLLEMKSDNPLFLILNNFKGWQSIKLKSSFDLKEENSIVNNFINNSKVKMSGLYEIESILPNEPFYKNFGNLIKYDVDINNEIEKYIISINEIKNSKIMLKRGSFVKLNKNLETANINLVTSIAKDAAIKFLESSLLLRQRSTARVVEFLDKNLKKDNEIVLNFNADPFSPNVIETINNFNVISSGSLNTNYIFDDNPMPNYINGSVQYYLELKNFETEFPEIIATLDLTNSNIFVRQINFNKDSKTKLKIKFEGKTNSLNDSVFRIKSFDSDIDLNGKVNVSKTNHIYLESLRLNNERNVDIEFSGDFSERILNLDIIGNIIDLSKNKVEINKKKTNYYLTQENYKIKTNEVIFAGNVKAENFIAGIDKRGNLLSVTSRANSNSHTLDYTREKNEEYDINIIKSSDITYFVNSEHVARKLLSDGELKMTSIRDLSSLKANVKIDLQDFVLINTPASLKLLSLPSISGLVSVAEGERGIRFGYGELNYIETKDQFSEIEAFAVSDSLGLIMDGKIDRVNDQINMKGEISPMHLVNALIQKLPIIGQIMVGNEGEGMFSIDFHMNGKTDDPDVVSSPLTIIKPRIIERAIEAIENNRIIQQ